MPRRRLESRVGKVIFVGYQKAPESLHRVSLSVDGEEYSATIWRGSATQWRLLSVDIPNAGTFEGNDADYTSCRKVLAAAETMAKAAVADSGAG